VAGQVGNRGDGTILRQHHLPGLHDPLDQGIANRQHAGRCAVRGHVAAAARQGQVRRIGLVDQVYHALPGPRQGDYLLERALHHLVDLQR